jgi:hypothetical protein
MNREQTDTPFSPNERQGQHTTSLDRVEQEDELRLAALTVEHEERAREELGRTLREARAVFEIRTERHVRSRREARARLALREFERRLEASRMASERAKSELRRLEEAAPWDESVEPEVEPWRESAIRTGAWVRPGVSRIAVEPEPVRDPDPWDDPDLPREITSRARAWGSPRVP